MTSIRHRLLVPLTAAVLLLGACTAGGGEGTDDTDADTPTQESAQDVADAKDAGKDDPTKAAEPSSSAGAGCLEGTWLTDPDSVAAVAVAASGLEGYAPQVTVTGDALVTFADGVVRTEYVDQAAVMTVVVNGQEIRSLSRGTGIVVGSYTATDTEVVQSGLDTSGMTMVIETYVDGALQASPPDMVEDYLAATEAGGTSSYTCSATELVTTPVVPGVDTSGFATRLTRQ